LDKLLQGDAFAKPLITAATARDKARAQAINAPKNKIKDS
jgi:hypothetical protein